MIKKVLKFVFGVGTLAAMASVLIGCSEAPKYVQETENGLTAKLKETIKEKDGLNLERFEILAVDVEKSGFNFDVVFNGVANFENAEKAYLSANYKVDSKVFVDIRKNISKEDLFKIFSKIVNTYELEDYSIAPVKNFKDINEAIIKNTPGPFEGYKIHNGLTYQISMPEFNDQTKEISFNVKNLVKIHDREGGIGAGVGFAGDGSAGLGFGPIAYTIKSTFVITDKYTINASELNFEEFKNDPTKIFEYFIEAVNNRDGKYINAERINVKDVTYQNANELGINLAQIDKEMGK